jgi:hypothetical protein
LGNGPTGAWQRGDPADRRLNHLGVLDRGDAPAVSAISTTPRRSSTPKLVFRAPPEHHRRPRFFLCAGRVPSRERTPTLERAQVRGIRQRLALLAVISETAPIAVRLLVLGR